MTVSMNVAIEHYLVGSGTKSIYTQQALIAS